ncbi:hypothetical protein HAX54_035057, partial [Datura stramonium]|nr:hypothetical protein [Datura stramonium]
HSMMLQVMAFVYCVNLQLLSSQESMKLKDERSSGQKMAQKSRKHTDDGLDLRPSLLYCRFQKPSKKGL